MAQIIKYAAWEQMFWYSRISECEMSFDVYVTYVKQVENALKASKNDEIMK